MRKKWEIVLIICLIAAGGLWSIPKKPKLISSITTKDTAYLTILVDKREANDPQKLRDELLEMCKADAFETIKLNTEDKPLAKRLHISVYTSWNDLEIGNVCLTIKHEEEE